MTVGLTGPLLRSGCASGAEVLDQALGGFQVDLPTLRAGKGSDSRRSSRTVGEPLLRYHEGTDVRMLTAPVCP
eukprot:11241368-Alexandrium_andersonii.AAC.1